MLASLIALAAVGCTSEADLVETLSTTTDTAVREKAAADLAKRCSLEATELLVVAAADDKVAADGLDALAEAYGDWIGEQVEAISESGEKKLDEKTSAQLEEVLACLSSMGSEAAIAELIEVGTDTCTEAYLRTIRNSAGQELCDLGEASLAQIMALAPDDEWVCGVLMDMDDLAVPALLAELAEQKWCEAVLADIGAPAVDAVYATLTTTDGVVAHRSLGVLLRMYDDFDPAADEVLLTPEMAPILLADLVDSTFKEEDEAGKNDDGFDHRFLAEYALAEIGEPVAATVLASNYEDKWFILQMMQEVAVPLLTSTMNGEDRENAIMSAICLVYIGKDSPSAIQHFSDALDNNDLQKIADNYMYYIALGQEGSEQVITDALLKHGDKQMALDCLNSGNDALDAAGRKWASRHNYRVYKSTNTEASVQWGI